MYQIHQLRTVATSENSNAESYFVDRRVRRANADIPALIDDKEAGAGELYELFVNGDSAANDYPNQREKFEQAKFEFAVQNSAPVSAATIFGSRK